MKYLLLILAMTLCGTLNAQESVEDTAPQNYIDYDIDEIVSMYHADTEENLRFADITKDSSRPCNQGEESFGAFFKRFQKDREFRLSRLNPTPAILSEKDRGTALYTKKVCKLSVGKKINKFKDSYEEVDCGWLYVDADNVLYSATGETYLYTPTEDTDANGFLDGGATLYLFRRVNGKWMLIEMVNIG